jgi:hypothetical protein
VASTPAKESKKKKEMPKLDDFLEARDYTGAITLLEVGKLNLLFYFHQKSRMPQVLSTIYNYNECFLF